MSPPKLASVALLFLAAVLLLSASCAGAARTAPKSPKSSAGHDIPAVFAFGDSTLDAGNNNRFTTLVRADHPPYGRDFPGGVPTGRFSDGKLISDYIVASLGIKNLLPAYHDASVGLADAATGVSFASGGSGLDEMTAQNAMASTFRSQITDFMELLGNLGQPKATEIANKSLYILSSGTNDVTMNYYLMPFGRATRFSTIDQYHDYLIACFQTYIEGLYNLGARRFVVAGMPPVGCLPVQKTLRGMPGVPGCITDFNEAAERYNAALQKMLAKAETVYHGVKIAYVDIYNPLIDMLSNGQKYGFTEVTRGCCGTGTLEMGALCTNFQSQCSSPSQYMFFDSVHPTQATYKALADRILKTQIPQFTQ